MGVAVAEAGQVYIEAFVSFLEAFLMLVADVFVVCHSAQMLV